MIQAVSKAFFNSLAGNTTLRNMASTYGMRRPRSVARRFVAGETLDEAIAAARRVEAAGMQQTLKPLGAAVGTMAEADLATRACLTMIDDIVAAGIGRNISLTLTQIGLAVDRATCVDNLRRVLDAAGRHGFFVRIDMESSPFTQLTLDVFEVMWQQGYRNTGVVLQSCLPRSLDDARRMNELGARVRIVKGAYREPRTVAYRNQAQIDAAFVEITKLLLSHGTYPAIATHDPAMIDAARGHAAQCGVMPDTFEFQMLYGVRSDLQAQLTAEGFHVRVYVPFGREWFPYLMRRLGERPANVGFVIRGILKERDVPRHR